MNMINSFHKFVQLQSWIRRLALEVLEEIRQDESIGEENLPPSELYPLFLKPGLGSCVRGVKNSDLTGRFPTVLYALVPAYAKLAHFGLSEEIAQD